MPKLNKLGQRGDTIVEVLICMAIVGFALSTCYTIARRSLFLIRQSEEHSQSLQLAQGQLERFRAYLSVNSSASTDPSSPNFILTSGQFGFCILNLPGGLFLQALTTDPKDARCAVDQSGSYYCEGHPCPSGLTRETVDGAGFFFRAGVAYCHSACAGAVDDQFSGLGGRYAVGALTSNTESFDAVSIPYRIHQ